MFNAPFCIPQDPPNFKNAMLKYLKSLSGEEILEFCLYMTITHRAMFHNLVDPEIYLILDGLVRKKDGRDWIADLQGICNDDPA